MRQGLPRLVEHLVWANMALIDSLRPQDQVPARAIQILSHLLAAEEVWLSRIRGERSALPVWPDLSLADCEALSSWNAEALRDLVEPYDEARLRTRVSYTNTRGERFENVMEDILFHVCMHGSYHRGQIATLVRAGGGAPINTDFITYARSAGGQEP